MHSVRSFIEMEQSPKPIISAETAPLCVDLDGTLVKTDVFVESLLAFIKLNILNVFLVLKWLLKGKAYLKRELAIRIKLDPATLPYNEGFLEFLRKQKQSGRKLVLATASDVILAEPIAKYLGIFDDIVASNGNINLSGAYKLAELEKRYGPRNFAYAGNSHKDLIVWRGCMEVIVVNALPWVEKSVLQQYPSSKIFVGQLTSSSLILRALRVHQWAKNILIFVALVMSHRMREDGLIFYNTLGFLSFCFAASAVYVLNDLFDLSADRLHNKKKNRPIASGEISIVHAIYAVPILFGLSIFVSSLLPVEFLAILVLYIVTTTAYSFYLKRIAILDILILAGLYTVRIIAGGLAVDVPVSEWLLAFSMFFFLSLALIKRFSELQAVEHDEIVAGRGYSKVDLELVSGMGSASGFISALVLALYVSSDAVKHLYSHPQVIWLLCPVMLYWICRAWLLAHRGEMHDDPIVFAIKDRTSYIVGAVAALILYLAA